MNTSLWKFIHPLTKSLIKPLSILLTGSMLLRDCLSIKESFKIAIKCLFLLRLAFLAYTTSLSFLVLVLLIWILGSVQLKESFTGKRLIAILSLFSFLYPLLLLATTSQLLSLVLPFGAPIFLSLISRTHKWAQIGLIIQIILIYFFSGLIQERLWLMDPKIRSQQIVCTLEVHSLLLFLILWARETPASDITKTPAQDLKAQEEKEKALQLSNFLLKISHEIRNPLNSLIGNVQLALFEDVSLEAKGFLENAQMDAEILLNSLNNILDIGKAEAGTLEIREETIDLYILCQKLWGFTNKMITQKKLNGTLRISKKVPQWLKLDHYRVVQILLNIVTNAVKFTEKGRISIQFDWISDKVNVDDSSFLPRPFDSEDEGIFEKDESISLFNNSDFYVLNTKNKDVKPLDNSQRRERKQGILKITVTDSGCGISPENLTKIFSKFFQSDKDFQNRQIGTGIGLFISHELCLKMKGNIRAYSRLGKGSSFICCIPSVQMQETDLILPEIGRKTHIYQGRIEDVRMLIVDDDKFNREILANFYAKLGIKKIHYAADGMEAYKIFRKSYNRKEKITHISMDYDMPVMNGKESALMIRKFEQENKLIPCQIIMISGHCDKKIMEECLSPHSQVRASHFFKKPITFDELKAVWKN